MVLSTVWEDALPAGLLEDLAEAWGVAVDL
jgi:hypothetical protein